MIEKLFSPVATVAAAAVAVAVVLAPWPPAGPHAFDNLDPNLLHVQKVGASTVAFRDGGAVVTTPHGTASILHVISTPGDFTVAFQVTVQSDDSATQGGFPMLVRLSYPAAQGWIAIGFQSGSGRHVLGSTFDGTKEANVTDLGPYQVGAPYRVLVDWRKGATATFWVARPDGTISSFGVGPWTGLKLFDQKFMNLTLESAGANGAQKVAISKFSLVIPAQTTYAVRASNLALTILTMAIVLWFLAALVYRGAPWLSRWFHALRRPKARAAGLIGLGVVATVGVYAALAPIDAHPYDRLAQESYAYVSDQYGLSALYDRTDYIPDAAVRGGTGSWSSPPFAYPPAMAYPYWFIGKAWHVLHGSITPLKDRAFQVFWKLVLALFVLVTALAIYSLCAGVKGRRWGLFAAAAYALNPAIVFDAAVWGETEAIVTSAILVSTFGFVREKPRLGWAALAVAALLKQTALFALPVLAVYSAKKYGWRRSLTEGCFGLVTGFAVSAPAIFAGYGPSTIYRSVISQVVNFANPTPVNASADSFSVWTLLNGLHGLHGFDRIWAPYPLVLGGLNLGFSTVGTVAFGLVLITVLMVISSAGSRLDEVMFLAVAALMCWYVTLSTLASARYLLLAVPFLILTVAATDRRRWLLFVGVLSAIALLSMYGILMVIAVRGDWPVFYGLGNPSTNGLSRDVYQLYTSDWGITAGATLLVFTGAALLATLISRASAPAPVASSKLAPLEPS